LKRSNRLVLLIGVFLAIVAFVGVVLLFGGNTGGPSTASPTPPTTATVVIAKVDIPLGTQVTAEMLDTKTVPIAEAGSSFTNPGLVISKTIRKTALAGTQLTVDYFVDLGQTTNVTDNLPGGLRAIAVQVDQVTGVGTLIHTGDSVDVIISVKIQQFAPNAANNNVTPLGQPQPSVKMVIQNVKVVGTLLPPPPAQTTAASPTPAPSGGQPATTLNGQQEIPLLAVTANQAEVIRYAQLYTDPISLVLRSPKDFVGPEGSPTTPPIEKTDGVVLQILIQKYGVLAPSLLTK
jgi:pilus assembly protein CpaB